MILHGNPRGNSKNLAQHLTKDENETVEIYQVRGFIGHNLEDAFRMSHALSRATKCTQHLYSLSLNPPKEAKPTPEEFEAAINKVEKQLGFVDQPRVIVFHEKIGLDGEVRKHAHAVWCRIDTANMKAIPLPFHKMQLRGVSRDLFVHHNWRMPDGLLDSKNRNPRNFTLAEWQQAKRIGKDPKQLKAMFQDTWTLSDGQAAFKSALNEQGYILAQGRRGHVAVDYHGEVYAISKWTGQKAKQVRERLGALEELPSVDQAHAIAARTLTKRLVELRDEQTVETEQKLEQIERTRNHTQKQKATDFQELKEQQKNRQQSEQEKQAARLRKGIPGFIDRFTGKRKRTLELNAIEARHTELIAKNEQTLLQNQYKDAFKSIETQATELKTTNKAVNTELKKDIQRLKPPPELLTKTYDTDEEKTRNRRNRQYSRDGRDLER